VSGTARRFRAVLLPDGSEPVDLWVRDGRITFRPVDGAESAEGGGWVLPGLVDSHAHLTVDFGGEIAQPASPELFERHMQAMRAAGILVVRDIGAVSDLSLRARDAGGWPRLHVAGQFMAPQGRFHRTIHQPLDAAEVLPATRADLASGADWVKIIGDWPDEGGLTLNYPVQLMTQVAEAAHAQGKRLAVHAVGEQAAQAAIAAGADSVEHGTGLTEGMLATMAERGIAWTPTICAVSAGTGHGELLERLTSLIPTAHRQGVRILAGTDTIAPGSLSLEIAALVAAGLEPGAALAAASTGARKFLGLPGLDEGAPADLVFFNADPREHPEVLREPSLILAEGISSHAMVR
jgi:imidazolonepropionase-like amidohydrolase